jgi:predicted metal-dependent phosphoesterase TrpH
MQKDIQSLHSHTLLSDGTQTHQEVLDCAQKYGVSVVAFTDHDALPSLNQIDQLKALNHPTKWFIGIEMSSGLPKELGKDNGPHILGLFVDPRNKALLEHCEKTQNQRVERMQSWVKSFQDLGFDITEEDVLKATTGASIGQPHFVKALKAKDQNIKLMDEFVTKMKKAGENDPEVKKKYDLMIQQGEYQYPYVLFLKEDAFVPGIYFKDKYFLDLDQSVSLIRQAGGVAVIAHYTASKKNITYEVIENLLKDNRLDGAETAYGFWGYGNDQQKEIESDRNFLRKILQENNKLASGGADSHLEKDFSNFASHSWLSAETVGMVEKIIKQISPNLTWANL